MITRQAKALTGAGIAAALVASLLTTTAAQATDGYFANGVGARHKALAGAGVADGRDATVAAINPAGILRAGNELDISASFFDPEREFRSAGGGFLPAGTTESDRNFFLIPNIARNWKTVGNPYFDALTLSMTGIGGMNTTYGAVTNPICGGLGAAAAKPNGVFCGGKSGVDLTQLLISLAMAKSFGNVSVGLAPTVAAQLFAAKGLGTFGNFGVSSSPANLTNNTHEVVFGAGLRGGIEWAVTPSMRVGVAGSTKIYSQKFDDYRGLFAEQGDFDIPANLQAGIAVDLSPAFTVMADYKRIWYSDVESMSNASNTILLGRRLGASNGPGFGWADMDIFKLGLEMRATPDLTLRAGYSYNTQQIKSRDVMLNLLAPGVVQHHITGGFMYRMSPNMDLEFAAMYAPRTHVSGNELNFGFGTPALDISMAQYEATIGIKYRFDSPASFK